LQLKNLGHHQFIEKPSKGLKNSYVRGQNFEQRVSKRIHANETAILVSSLVLRSLNCGQIDICTYKNEMIVVYEVKYGGQKIPLKQYRRLLNSANLLSYLFQVSSKILLVNDLPKE
jgi:Holliday junction resolvase-like predicted endonuclease